MAFEQAHLAAHPLPAGIVGALGLGGYQLLVDVAGVGAGRLGRLCPSFLPRGSAGAGGAAQREGGGGLLGGIVGDLLDNR